MLTCRSCAFCFVAIPSQSLGNLEAQRLHRLDMILSKSFQKNIEQGCEYRLENLPKHVSKSGDREPQLSMILAGIVE